MEYLTSLISISDILELPWYIGITGLVIVALFVWSALWSLLSLRLARAFSRLVLAAIVLIILSQGGDAIVQLMGEQSAGADQ